MQHSIVNLNEIRKSPFGNRIDAEFYLPDYIRLDAAINKTGFEPLSQITSKIDVGFVGPMAQEYTEDGVWLLQTQNVQEFFLSEASQTRINTEFHHYLDKSKVRKGDILIARRGSFGKASIYLEDEEINSADIIIIRCIEKRVNPFYLVAFLNCTFGTNQLLRYASGGVQGHVNLTILENLKICNLDADFQKRIESICKQSYLAKQQGEQLYSQAQTLLLSELGLTDWDPRHNLTFVKNYADIQRAGRIDAEYFQPKYDDIVDAIERYPDGWDTLGRLVSIRKCVEVGSRNYEEEGVPFVRVSNFTPFEITEEKYISEDLYAEIKQHQPKQGEILFSNDGTPGIAHYLREQPKKMIPSGGILRLGMKTDRVAGEYLTLVLNSTLTQEQANRDGGGSVILHWRPDQTKDVAIPIFSDDKQAQIQSQVSESFSLRKQSKHLLECAKRTVEIAIEQDEQAAIEWLRSEAQLQEDSHVYNGEKLPAILVPADISNADTFPESWKDLVIPVVDALVALDGKAPRKQLITQLIGKLRLPPYTDDNYWEGLARAHRAPKRKRRDLFEERLNSALQFWRKKGRIKSQGRNWHLQS